MVKMNIRGLVERARKNGIHLLVLQWKPYADLVFSEKDPGLMVDAFSQALAYAAQRIAKEKGADPAVVLKDLVGMAFNSAEKKLQEEAEITVEQRAAARDLVKSAFPKDEEDEEIDITLDQDHAEED